MVCKSILSQKRQRTENETRSAKLSDLDVLDCPVCFEPLTVPTFQCDDGHLVCSLCLAKVSNKCPGPGCDLPIGNKRCIPMEKVIEAAFVPCRNAEFGCTNSFSYGKVSSHEKECNYSQCSCPNLDCNYIGSYTSIYSHYISSHLYENMTCSFRSSALVRININEKVLVLYEDMEKLLFVVQCFREKQGVYVTLRSIASSTPKEKISYWLSCNVDGHTLAYKSPEMKRFLEVSSHQIPEESYIFFPNSLLCGEMLEMSLSIVIFDGEWL
ncbi:PREDICTED: E3 ubiquitin-protein ligase SINA-like 11 [Camelina sativa]|uniref:RING-type E3 ubiquitin transferase n=1 Tax=Camelina sativa TaxID=90675 RepID=A0ABM0UPF6_CAMSA|nr:PREDICTED: E3 ubiquitin-protein ligase SINA-like 11 [Camelina sativa]